MSYSFFYPGAPGLPTQQQQQQQPQQPPPQQQPPQQQAQQQQGGGGSINLGGLNNSDNHSSKGPCSAPGCRNAHLDLLPRNKCQNCQAQLHFECTQNRDDNGNLYWYVCLFDWLIHFDGLTNGIICVRIPTNQMMDLLVIYLAVPTAVVPTIVSTLSFRYVLLYCMCFEDRDGEAKREANSCFIKSITSFCLEIVALAAAATAAAGTTSPASPAAASAATSE